MTTRSSRVAAIALVGLLPALVGWNWLQSKDPNVQSGNRHFKAGEYAKALKQYRSALGRKSDDPAVQFDIGTALYKLAEKANGKQRKKLLDQAEVAFRHGADAADAKLKSSAYFNLGNTQFARKRYGGAVSAYKDALRANPQNDAARYNLEMALRRLKRQHKQQRSSQQQKHNRNRRQRQRGNRSQQPQKQGGAQKNQQQSQQQRQPQQQQRPQSQPQKQGESGQQKQKQNQRQSQSQSQSQKRRSQSQQQQQAKGQKRGARSKARRRPGQNKTSPQRAGGSGRTRPPSESDRKLDELERLSRKAWLRHLRNHARQARRIDPEKDQ